VTTTAFGKIVVASELERSIIVLLKKWFPTYLREIERNVGWRGEELPTPRNYGNRNSFDLQAGEEIPKVVVISPGLFEVPEHPEGDGYYSATWQVGVGIATAARTEEEADRKAKMYAAAMRGILIQHQDLEDPELGVSYVTWLDESYDDLDIDDQYQRARGAGVYIGVEVEDAVNRYMRPPMVSEAPQTTIPIDTVITDVDKQVDDDTSHGVTTSVTDLP
jgi:hypothetical protein